jgi:hypothetical protein
MGSPSCPAQRPIDECIFLTPCSQGAQLIHNAAPQLDAVTALRVSSAVVFGGPKKEQLRRRKSMGPTSKAFYVAGNLVTWCFRIGSSFCRRIFRMGGNVDETAVFVMQQAGAGAAKRMNERRVMKQGG